MFCVHIFPVKMNSRTWNPCKYMNVSTQQRKYSYSMHVPCVFLSAVPKDSNIASWQLGVIPLLLVQLLSGA